MSRRSGLILSVFGLLVLASGVLFASLGDPMLWVWNLPSDLKDLFFQVRVPRVLLAAAVGAGLSLAGVSFQALLRNPLADPYILGVSGGAALGGILGLALGLSFHFIPVLAFLSALASLFLIYGIAQDRWVLSGDRLLLTGVIFNSFAFSLILFIHALANMGQLHQIFFLLVGTLDAIELPQTLGILFLTFICGLLLSLKGKAMNLLAVGDESAQQLGLNVQGFRIFIFVTASLLVGASVATAGLIGFVGLFVPHFARLLFGADHRFLIPASGLLGAWVLMFCDFLTRFLFAKGVVTTELPVGVLTALLGAPCLIWILRQKRGVHD